MADDLNDVGERSRAILIGTSDGITSPRVVRTQHQIGDTIEAESGCHYEILAKLGGGGMAEVYHARATKETGLQFDVALKCLRGALGEDAESEKMFLAEARVSSRVSHENIARASDLERSGGRLYLVLEYVEGVSLREVIRAATAREDPMPPEFVCYVGAAIADALHHVNTLSGPNGEPLGIVHRDLTAANVMVTRRGIPKLLDFGIAYARIPDRERTRTGVVRGTYNYLSPEQAAAGQAAKGEVDGRSDLFSLGLLLVELLTGRKVFAADDEWLTVKAIEECSAARVHEATCELPADLQRILRRLLQRRPEERFQTGEELAFELRAALTTREPLYGARECVVDLAALGLFQLKEGETNTRTMTRRSARKARARWWGLVVTASLTVGAGAGALGVRLVGPGGSPEQARGVTENAPVVSPPPPAEWKAEPPATEPAPAVQPPTIVPATTTAPAARSPTPEELGWPDGVPVRKKEPHEPRPDRRARTAPAGPTATPSAASNSAETLPASDAVRGRAGAGALLKFADRGIVKDATATLARGTVLRVTLGSSVTTAPREAVEAVVTEEAASGSVVIPRGAVVSCHTGSMSNGRLSVSCDTARSGSRVWTFSALALGDGDKAGLRVMDGGVAAGTVFAVAVTASAIVE